MAAGVAQIPWYATLFRGDQFAAALEEIAPIATRYGATDYRVYRNRDDMYKFTQLITFKDKSDFEAYWYGPEFNDWRADLLELVPDPDPLHLERPDHLGRAARRPRRRRSRRTAATPTATRLSRRTSCASGPAPCGAGPAAWPGSSSAASGPQRLADAGLHRGDEARLVVLGLELDLSVEGLEAAVELRARRPRPGRSA